MKVVLHTSTRRCFFHTGINSYGFCVIGVDNVNLVDDLAQTTATYVEPEGPECEMCFPWSLINIYASYLQQEVEIVISPSTDLNRKQKC